MITNDYKKDAQNVAHENTHLLTCANTDYLNNFSTSKEKTITNDYTKVAQIFKCLDCDYITYRKSSYEKHIVTAKHIKITESCSKVANYDCLICDYTTCKKSSYDKHLVSSKHKKLLKSCKKLLKSCKNENENEKYIENESNSEDCETEQKCLIYTCEYCDKIYRSRFGIWKHKKKCKPQNNNDNKQNQLDTLTLKEECKNDPDKFMNVILEVVKSNSEFQKQMFEFVKSQSSSITNTNNNNNTNTNCMNNNNNKTFNLQFFLNETCKDAMNISDFVNSLHLQLSDLESVGSLGYVDGISKIIIKGLKALDETIRPIHCTDKKRETVYVKDENKWEKDENKTRLRKAITCVVNENMKLIPQWKAKHPDYLDSSSDCSDKYNNMVIEVLGGDDESSVSEDKIIRKIAKEVVIEKS